MRGADHRGNKIAFLMILDKQPSELGFRSETDHQAAVVANFHAGEVQEPPELRIRGCFDALIPHDAGVVHERHAELGLQVVMLPSAANRRVVDVRHVKGKAKRNVRLNQVLKL